MRYAKTMSEALADVREGFSKKEIKMAIGIASDPRYKGGNYTGAFNAIEKIKKGLAKHPQVAAVLKRQNEEIFEKVKCPHCEGEGCPKCEGKGYMADAVDKEDEPFLKDLIKNLRKGSATHSKQADDLEKAVKEDGHADVSSAMRQCKTITEDATEIDGKLQTMSPEDNLPTWWTNKLAVASNSMNKMRDYIVNPIQEETELDEMKEPFAVVDTADGNKVVGTASDEKGAKSIITSAELPPMKIKDKKTLKIMKSKKKQMIGQPFKEEVELDERKFEPAKSASGYDIFHKDFSSAMQHATAFAKKKGQPIKKDEIDNKVATGPKKPSAGKENSYTLETEKGKMWSVQVYNMGSKFELNMYLTSSHIPEGDILDEGTWAVPETPAQKRDLKKLLSKPLPLGKEGENASDKMYSIIGDDELFDDLYSAGKESPDSDARPIIKKAMKRLKIREDSWDSWRLDESTKPDHIKVFNSLKRGDKVEINYDSSIAGDTTKTFVIKTKNKVYKGKVDKVTMYPDGKTGGVKFHLYQYDNRPGVYMAIGDMGASLRDIKKI